LIREGEQYVAVVWFHSADDLLPGALMIHVCAAERYRGRWLSLRVIAEILGGVFDAGATRLYAHVTSEFVGRIWQRLGFKFEKHETEGLLAYKDQEEWLTT
jgi:RimJ/RimL family protein N-acetyltransferase